MRPSVPTAGSPPMQLGAMERARRKRASHPRDSAPGNGRRKPAAGSTLVFADNESATVRRRAVGRGSRCAWRNRLPTHRGGTRRGLDGDVRRLVPGPGCFPSRAARGASRAELALGARTRRSRSWCQAKPCGSACRRAAHCAHRGAFRDSRRVGLSQKHAPALAPRMEGAGANRRASEARHRLGRGPILWCWLPANARRHYGFFVRDGR